MSETPFKHNLIESDISKSSAHKLKEFEGNPNKIIRKYSFDSLERRPNSTQSENIDLFEFIIIGKKLFEELTEKYNISVPVDFVIGKDDQNENSLYVLTDRIEGDNLEQYITTGRKEIIPVIEDLYLKLVKYLTDKLVSGDYYLVDIFRPDQYVFGVKANDSKPRTHLVDTDLYIHNNKVNIYKYMLGLVSTIPQIEQNLDISLDLVRERINQFIATSLDNKNISNQESIKGLVHRIRTELKHKTKYSEAML